jgi:hypothetical protein
MMSLDLNSLSHRKKNGVSNVMELRVCPNIGCVVMFDYFAFARFVVAMGEYMLIS